MNRDGDLHCGRGDGAFHIEIQTWQTVNSCYTEALMVNLFAPSKIYASTPFIISNSQHRKR